MDLISRQGVMEEDQAVEVEVEAGDEIFMKIKLKLFFYKIFEKYFESINLNKGKMLN